ncbi:deoxyribose-phosphate aldolase [Lichenihabitans sp. PAMC28606]|uniref:deoxyribose-phosphate aldolase n=1 Tax=Lichenihabitans sp. PAMC28606 TaxID=2880932 RepID=UPI001D0B92D8|nr:deoxyribose-phosphate aldolase [Lichenihabitans sp. PAMC28606]UDL95718.1 deoxyribose-phosphate aldolase [Lichenihabitans sp. PAMC28606]
MSLYDNETPRSSQRSASEALDADAASLARLIDHTVLKPDTLAIDVDRFCAEAARFGFASVCVNGVYVSRVAERLAGLSIPACAVVGFPLGAMSTRAKAFEASDAVAAGAGEIDMVIHVGALKDRQFDAVEADIATVKRACGSTLLKVIIETCLLTDDEKRAACSIAASAGANFVKTSTGFGHAGATIEDVALMRGVVGDALGVKASGGIRTRTDAEQMVAAGASRIGASASVAIVQG